MGSKRGANSPIQGFIRWIKRQPPRVKTLMGVFAGLAALVLMRYVVVDHDSLFVAAEAIHALGVLLLVYKLQRQKTCTGLSLKAQQLTGLFLAVRLYCSVVVEHDIHTVLDTATLITTAWVIFTMRFRLKRSYKQEFDDLPSYFVVVPCAILALVIHPSSSHHAVNRILWAFCVYLEAVSVLPQVRYMQHTQDVETFTAHYVFALGVARFLSCAHWILQLIDGRAYLFNELAHGFWPSMVLLSEIVQTLVLADFCYYYVKSVLEGQAMLRLPIELV